MSNVTIRQFSTAALENWCDGRVIDVDDDTNEERNDDDHVIIEKC